MAGSVRIRTKSSRVRSFSSTRIGKRPCSSGIRSRGFDLWKAPAAMNRMWSVLIAPVTRLNGRPFDDRQQVALHALPADVGTAATLLRSADLVDLVDERRRRPARRDGAASSLTASLSTRLSISWSSSTRRASRTLRCRLVLWRGMIFSSIPCRSMSICSMPMLEKICTGEASRCSTVRSRPSVLQLPCAELVAEFFLASARGAGFRAGRGLLPPLIFSICQLDEGSSNSSSRSSTRSAPAFRPRPVSCCGRDWSPPPPGRG